MKNDHVESVKGITGKNGENIAVAYLEKLGYKILERNWRFRRGEIDIIASKNRVLHIVEVKTRTSTLFGYPEETIGFRKLRQLMNAAAAYCYQHPGWKIVQYDAVAVVLNGQDVEIEFFEDI